MAIEALENQIAINRLFRESTQPAFNLLRDDAQRRQDIILRQGDINAANAIRGQKIRNLEAEFGLRRELSTSEIAGRKEISTAQLENAITLSQSRITAGVESDKLRLEAQRTDADIDRGQAIEAANSLQQQNSELIRLRDSQRLSPAEIESIDRRAALEAGVNLLPDEIERIEREADAMRLKGDLEEADEHLFKNGLDREKIGEMRLLSQEGINNALKNKQAPFQFKLNDNIRRITLLGTKFNFATNIVPNAIAPTRPAVGGPVTAPGGKIDLGGTDAAGPAGPTEITTAEDLLSPEFLAREKLQERGSDPAFIRETRATDPPGTVISRFFDRPFTDPKRVEAQQKAFRIQQDRALERASKFVIRGQNFTLRELVDKAVNEGDDVELRELLEGATGVLKISNFSPDDPRAGNFLQENFGTAFELGRITQITQKELLGEQRFLRVGKFEKGGPPIPRDVLTPFTFSEQSISLELPRLDFPAISESVPELAPIPENSILGVRGF